MWGKKTFPDESRPCVEMCSGFEAGSYSRLIDFVCHSTLGLRVIKRRVDRASATRER